MDTSEQVPGYSYGLDERGPFSLDDLEKLKKTLLLGEEDLAALRKSHDILRPHTDEIVGVWYDFVGSHDFLLHYFSKESDGTPNPDYLAAVRKRFERWILDTARAEYNQSWLDWQFEIGRRHHRIGKNQADNADAVDHISYRYIPAFIVPLTTTLKPFLARASASAEEVEAMHAAWVKATTLQVILWSYPYIREGDW